MRIVTPLSPSDTIRTIYVPAMERVHSDKPKGIRVLMAAQAMMEGYFPKSLSFRTNNPGNVGTNGIDIGKFPTLEAGIAAQWNQVLGRVFQGKSSYYKKTDSLFQYLSTYAPVMSKDKNGKWYKSTNDPTAYTNFVINYFKGQGYNITSNTTLQEIYNIVK